MDMSESGNSEGCGPITEQEVMVEVHAERGEKPSTAKEKFLENLQDRATSKFHNNIIIIAQGFIIELSGSALVRMAGSKCTQSINSNSLFSTHVCRLTKFCREPPEDQES